MKRVAVDLDSTVFDFTGFAVRWMSQNFNIEPVDIGAYDITDIFGISKEQAKRIAPWLFEAYRKNASMYPGAYDELLKLKQQGRLCFATSRKDDICAETKERLAGFGLDDIPIAFSNGSPNKNDLLRELGADILVDDYPDTIYAAAQDDFEVVKFWHPYNATVNPRNMFCAKTWEQIGIILAALR